jgi:hypothetical protein
MRGCVKSCELNYSPRRAAPRRDHGEETLAKIGRAYNVSGWTISRLQ